jgi:DNA repair protein RadC
VHSGEILGIPLLDHLVVGTRSYVSFADRGWI